MKKILLLLLVLPLFYSCSSDDDDQTQDYTSFVFYQPADIDVVLPNCVAAYKADGKFYRIANLGELSKGKYSEEIILETESISEIYFFTDYLSTRRFDAVYVLKNYYKNIFTLEENTKGIVITDKTDPTQYPQ